VLPCSPPHDIQLRRRSRSRCRPGFGEKAFHLALPCGLPGTERWPLAFRRTARLERPACRSASFTRIQLIFEALLADPARGWVIADPTGRRV